MVSRSAPGAAPIPLRPPRRWCFPPAAPIVIGDDVFVGMEALVLKGVTIGDGAVVGAGAVVTQDVPPRTVVAGNPAQAVRDL